MKKIFFSFLSCGLIFFQALTGNVVANSLVENPNQNETVEMEVTDLTVCNDCE